MRAEYPRDMPLRLDFVTLFPETVRNTMSHSIMRRAVDGGAATFGTTNPRDFCYDRHLKVDDTPFGGEPGMLIRAEPIALALESLGIEPGDGDPDTVVVMTDPTGARFDQALAHELSTKQRLVFLCGHYEGIDHRIAAAFSTRAVSIGDFVLTNGEMPALVMADAVVRLLPGVLGSEKSLEADSHSDGLLSAPNFTRPEVWRGLPIPEVLKSGDHQAIASWRRRESLRSTLRLRPDLLARAKLDKQDVNMLSS